MLREFLAAEAGAALLATVAPAVLFLLLAYVLRLQWGRQRPNPVPARAVVERLERERVANPNRYAVPAVPAWTVPTTRKLVAL